MASPLLPFSGGLRNQATFIIKAIAHFLDEQNEKRVLCDPFFGGGSISFTARLNSFKVYSSDIAKRPVIPANCLIKETDIIHSYEMAEYNSKVYDNFTEFNHLTKVKKILYKDSIDVLRRLWVNADTPTLQYIALRSFFELVPMGGFGLMKKTEKSQTALDLWEKCRGKYDDLNPVLDKVRGLINGGLVQVQGLPVGEVYQKDARDHILDSIKGGATAVHLDPPTYGSKGYTNLYWWLDAILEDTVVEESEGFTRDQALSFVGECVEVSNDLPLVAITQQEVSYPLEDATKVLKDAGRTVYAYEIPIANTVNPFYIAIGIK